MKKGDVKGKQKMHKEDRAPIQVDAVKETWIAPSPGWVKINTDASFQDDSGEASAGIIVRMRKVQC